MKYYYNLDGVRALAALMVLVQHFFFSENVKYLEQLVHYQKFAQIGQHGVSLFFCLSGFVITRILINTRFENDYFINFYKRRALRIFPLYYLGLFAYYFVFPIIFNEDIVDFKLQMPYYFYLQNFTEVLKIDAIGPIHYWSLAVEEHFYLLWPLVIFIVKPKHIWKFIIFSFIIILLLKYYMLNKGLTINYFTFTRIDQIMFGAFLAILEMRDFFKLKRTARIMFFSGFLSLLLGAIINLISSELFFVKEIFKYPILGLFFSCLIGFLISLSETHLINRILKSKVLQYLGRISYGIYVWHVLALAILNKVFISGFLLFDFFLALILTILISHLSFFYFENYFLKFKKKRSILNP